MSDEANAMSPDARAAQIRMCHSRYAAKERSAFTDHKVATEASRLFLILVDGDERGASDAAAHHTKLADVEDQKFVEAMIRIDAERRAELAVLGDDGDPPL